MNDWFNIAVLLGYLLFMLLLGVWCARRNNSTEEYFVGGRAFPGWAIGLSLIGTSLSSVTFIAFPADAFKTAWLRFLPNLMLIPAILIASFFFLPKFRSGNYTTAYQYLGDRFNGSIRTFAALAFIVAQMVRLSLILYLVSLVLEKATGLDPTLCIVIGGVIVVAYTVVGGIDAVIWTDVVQTIVLAFGGLFCLAFIIWQLPGGFGEILEVGVANSKFSFAAFDNGVPQPTSWLPSLTEKTAAMMLVVGLISFVTEYCGNQNVVQRYFAARSDRDARQAMYLCGAGSMLSWALFMFVGTALFVFYQAFPNGDASAILTGADGRKAEEIMPLFILNELPAGIAGLVLAAALAAAMSSLDSSINAIAAVGITDLYKPFRKPPENATDEKEASATEELKLLRLARVLSLIAGVGMIGGATVLLNVETKTLQDTATILTSLLAAGLLGIYLLGFFTRSTNATGIWCGLACAMMYTLWSGVTHFYGDYLPPTLRLPLDPYYTGFIGNLFVLLIGASVSMLIQRRGSKSK